MRLATFAAALALGSSAPALGKTTIIHADAVVIDADAAVRGQSTVIVTDGRIVSIEDGFVDGPAGAEMVHLAGKTLVPGLTDLHVHLTGDPGGDFWKEAVEPEDWGVVVGAKNALITAKAGFTTVREAGSAPTTIRRPWCRRMRTGWRTPAANRTRTVGATRPRGWTRAFTTPPTRITRRRGSTSSTSRPSPVSVTRVVRVRPTT